MRGAINQVIELIEGEDDLLKLSKFYGMFSSYCEFLRNT